MVADHQVVQRQGGMKCRAAKSCDMGVCRYRGRRLVVDNVRQLALDVVGCDDPLAKRKAYKLDESGDMGHDLAT